MPTLPDREEFMRYIHASIAPISRCYGLTSGSSIGITTFDLRLRADGHVQQVHVRPSRPTEQRTIRCMEQLIANWVFAAGAARSFSLQYGFNSDPS